MANMSTYLSNKLVDHALGTATFTKPTTVYIALFTTNQNAAGSSGVEVSGNAYARQAIAFSAAASASTTNSGTVTFPAATPAGWGTVTGWAIYDAASAGNLLWFGALSASKAIAVGDSFKFNAGDVSIADA